MQRRDFLLNTCALGAGTLLSGAGVLRLFGADKPKDPAGFPEAVFYDGLAGKRIQCHVCPFD
ncbi:MAG: hypothetical protein HYY93_01495 [Planctomycetes bacterium]|nr:hypothetical protein [Planctomycetota bacterium]